MTAISRWLASAALGGLALLGVSEEARADGAGPPAGPLNRVSTVSAGSIRGVVQDEKGAPVSGALVSALGATKAYAVTDRSGRFELRTLSPGAYLLRAHSSGFVASRGQMIEVLPSGHASSTIGLRRATSLAASPSILTPALVETTIKTAPPSEILQAGVALPGSSSDAAAKSAPAIEPESPPAAPEQTPAAHDDHGELAWHLRHLRRSVLQDASGPALSPADSASADPIDGQPSRFGGLDGSDGSPLRMAANLFSGAPLSGELNFLTTSSFDSPQQLFNGDMYARNVAYMAVGAPAGSRADWAVRGALSQADISAWVVAGTYAGRGPAGHRYEVGLSYATQRYDGGNPAALRDVTDGSRNAGALYGFDTWTLSPALALSYGARYDRYDYLETKGLISPRVAMTVSAGDRFRITTSASRRAIAPGAEEFLPPGDNGVWLPPQRTFSSFTGDGSLNAERTSHLEIDVERDLGLASTVTIRAFRQFVTDQLVTMFGVDMPGLPAANIGHYFVGNYGDVEARGIAASLRTVVGRVHGSVAYTMTNAQWKVGDDLNYWLLQMPGTPPHPDRLHSLSTSIQADVPETATRVVVVYRISNAFARQGAQDGTLDSRFDVEVHQSLPFMDFSSAKWEMLVGVRNFFRETAADQSVFDELLVVHPPKRIVGGLTMRF